jgi:hypothetical protein
MRKRKTTYPPKRNDTKRAPATGGGPQMRPPVVTIDTTAIAGKGDLKIGDRVRITGTGFLAGETAVVETLAGGLISAAFVRTDSGQGRRVRTIDLEPITESEPAEPTADLPG